MTMTFCKLASVRTVVGIAAACGTTLQCSIGMGFQLADAIRMGGAGVSLPLFALSFVAMTAWSLWAFLKEEGIEWVAFVPNTLGALGSAAICAVLLFTRLGQVAPAHGITSNPLSTRETSVAALAPREPSRAEGQLATLVRCRRLTDTTGIALSLDAESRKTTTPLSP